LWGFPKKLASPKLETEIDTLVGTLGYGKVRIAKATMVSNTTLPATRVCKLVRYYSTEITRKGAWTGPGHWSGTRMRWRQ
jgi:acetoacetate decarboxylase